MLTADVVRWICPAARVKLPLSAMATKVRNTSLSSSGSEAVGRCSADWDMAWLQYS